MQPFLAFIMPVGGGDGGSGQPPRPWGPINYPDQGLPGNQPYPDQSLPGDQPRPWGPINYPDQGLPGVTPPLTIWGGGGVGSYPDAGFPGPQPGQPPRPWGPINYPDQGLPGAQPGRPGGGRPTHPIWFPPVIWDPSRPANPIVNPGDPDQPGQGQPKIEWKTAWSPSTGWIVVGVPTGEHVTPSGGEQPK